MDPAIAKQAQSMDITQRLELADELERRASQFRGFASKKIEADTLIAFGIRPQMKKAIQAYAKVHGAEKDHDMKNPDSLKFICQGILFGFWVRHAEIFGKVLPY